MLGKPADLASMACICWKGLKGQEGGCRVLWIVLAELNDVESLEIPVFADILSLNFQRSRIRGQSGMVDMEKRLQRLVRVFKLAQKGHEQGISYDLARGENTNSGRAKRSEGQLGTQFRRMIFFVIVLPARERNAYEARYGRRELGRI